MGPLLHCSSVVSHQEKPYSTSVDPSESFTIHEIRFGARFSGHLLSRLGLDMTQQCQTDRGTLPVEEDWKTVSKELVLNWSNESLISCFCVATSNWTELLMGLSNRMYWLGIFEVDYWRNIMFLWSPLQIEPSHWWACLTGCTDLGYLRLTSEETSCFCVAQVEQALNWSNESLISCYPRLKASVSARRGSH